MSQNRLHHRAIPTLFSAAFSAAGLALGLAWAPPAQAVISILGASNASGFSLTGSTSTTNGTPVTGTTATVTIYGGTAGLSNSNKVTNQGGLFDTCANPPTPLFACNNQAINPAAGLSIQFESTTTDGIPSVTYTGNGGSGTLTNNSGSTSIAHGNPVTFSTTWGAVCTAMSQTDGNIASDCTISTGTTVTATFTATITSTTSTGTTGGTTTTAGTDTGTFTITITDGLPASSSVDYTTTDMTVEACDPNTPSNDVGLCHFEIGSRDSAISVKNLSAVSTFPTLNTVPIQQIVVLWAPGQYTFSSIKAPAASNLNVDHAFLSVLNNGDGSVDLQSSNVSGFTNDQYYSFKIALQDMAGNIGYYTASDDSGQTGPDYSCDSGIDCHVGHPGAVEGVLSKQLNCFIATAAYGSPMAPQVETFRQFRNAFLIPTHWGRRFVRFYYAHSPYYAHFIAEHPALRTLARICLYPLLGFAQLSLKYGALSALCFLASLVLLLAFAASQLRRRGQRA